ncbi:MAG: ATP-dependent DNA helicase RecG, partial [Bacteroidales bacterium]|nr:ATP-dependent DNA helicase RecG [Bacteroidales bacterium]
METGVQFLPGVGPRRAALLASELSVRTVGDLLRLYPFRYIDRSSIQRIADVRSDAAYVQILARVVSAELTGKGGKRLSVVVQDDSGQMELVFFRGVKYTSDRLKPGSVFLFFGKPTAFNGRLNMVHP